MSTMTIELYDALIAAGSPEDKAKLASQVVTEQQSTINQEVSSMRMDIAKLKLGQMAIIAVSAAGFGYIISMLNTVIGKLG